MSAAPARPGAVLALWNGVDQHRAAEYERWHTLEHVPQRVGVPGFLAGTRYASAGTGPTVYFTLYELASLHCLESQAYRDLVSAPTPWSAAMRPALQGFVRKPCVLAADLGGGAAVGIVALRVVPAHAGRDASNEALHRLAEDAWRGRDARFITRVQVGTVAPAGPQALANVDSAPPGPELLLLVQTSKPEHLGGLEQDLVRLCRRMLGESAWVQHGSFHLASRIEHREALAVF